jgi:hypothetical protein
MNAENRVRQVTAEEQAETASWYRQAHADVKALNLNDSTLWEKACGEYCDHFWGRQGAYMELNRRGYDMPPMLPIRGDAMPERRKPVLRLVND